MAEEQKSDVTAIVVTRKGKTEELLKGSDGRFVKKPRRMVTTLEITRMGRRLMNMPVGEKLGKKDMNRFDKIFMSLYDIATSENAKDDPKYAMASVQAAKELMLRVAGKPSASDEEIDAFKKNGIKFVMLPVPEMMNPQPIEEEEKVKKLKPSFIDAEIVKTNEPEK